MSDRDSTPPKPSLGDRLRRWSPAKAVQAVFTSDVGLQRGAQGLKVVLRPTTPPQADDPGERAPGRAGAPSAGANTMRSELTTLLDHAPGSRRVMRHLAAIENGLAHKDPKALFLFDQPAQRIKAAMRELDTVTGGTPLAGLARLRTQMAAALASRESRDRQAVLQQPISSFLTDDKLHVSEVRHSDFDKATAGWRTPPAEG